MKYRSYPKTSGMTSDSAHKTPIVAVDTDWVEKYGNRAQRRRIQKELKRQKRSKR